MSMNVQCLMEGGWHLVQSVENIGDGEERGGERAPSAEGEDDGLVNGTSDIWALGRHVGHGSRFIAEEVDDC